MNSFNIAGQPTIGNGHLAHPAPLRVL